jgi:uncharacterized protein (DUF1778 family)
MKTPPTCPVRLRYPRLLSIPECRGAPTHVGRYSNRSQVETRSTDAKGRVCLLKEFANATVIIDQLSDTELRIRKAVVIPQDEIRFAEETAVPLSDPDRDRFLELLDNPPKANAALRRAAAWRTRRYG